MDRNDARGIAEAVRTKSRSIKEVYQKSQEAVDIQTLLSARRLLVGQRTAINSAIDAYDAVLGYDQSGRCGFVSKRVGANLFIVLPYNPSLCLLKSERGIAVYDPQGNRIGIDKNRNIVSVPCGYLKKGYDPTETNAANLQHIKQKALEQGK